MDDLYLDIEASGLTDDSYPIEIGWAEPVPGFPSESFLVRPFVGWVHWDEVAAGVHNIPREKLLHEGLDVITAAERINAALEGKRVHADSLVWDGFWLQRLFEAAGVAPAFRLHSTQGRVAPLIKEVDDDPQQARSTFLGIYHSCEHLYPVTHRAAPDATNQAAVHLALVDKEFRDEITMRSLTEAFGQ